MNGVLDGGNPLDLPLFEDGWVFKTAGLPALLLDPGFGIAGCGQSHFNRKLIGAIDDHRKGIGIDSSRIIGFNVCGHRIEKIFAGGIRRSTLCSKWYMDLDGKTGHAI
ncbi:MAG TPA: hypothetical protein VHY22_13015 [Chthoniobacteraceae bacterium]|jgi:hypothetical protein|nr:hypothetical protein [Chthoniobacteraceae bacterium]